MYVDFNHHFVNAVLEGSSCDHLLIRECLQKLDDVFLTYNPVIVLVQIQEFFPDVVGRAQSLLVAGRNDEFRKLDQRVTSLDKVNHLEDVLILFI